MFTCICLCVYVRVHILYAHTRAPTPAPVGIRQQECPTKSLHYLTLCRHPRCPTASPGHATTRSTPWDWTGRTVRRGRLGSKRAIKIIILTSSLSAAPPCGDSRARMLGSAEVRSSFLDDSLSVLSRSPPSAPPIPQSAEVDFSNFGGRVLFY